MSSMVDIWVSKLAKLGEKHRAGAGRSGGDSEAGDEGRRKETEGAVRRQTESTRRRSSLSEATVCMLMDRFAPC